jgi:hypothetical protein
MTYTETATNSAGGRCAGQFPGTAAIEDTDAAALWQTFQTTPKIIVIEVFAGSRLERIDLATLGLTPDMTCSIAQSFPAAPIAWNMNSTA